MFHSNQNKLLSGGQTSYPTTNASYLNTNSMQNVGRVRAPIRSGTVTSLSPLRGYVGGIPSSPTFYNSGTDIVRNSNMQMYQQPQMNSVYNNNGSFNSNFVPGYQQYITRCSSPQYNPSLVASGSLNEQPYISGYSSYPQLAGRIAVKMSPFMSLHIKAQLLLQQIPDYYGPPPRVVCSPTDTKSAMRVDVVDDTASVQNGRRVKFHPTVQVVSYMEVSFMYENAENSEATPAYEPPTNEFNGNGGPTGIDGAVGQLVSSFEAKEPSKHERIVSSNIAVVTSTSTRLEVGGLIFDEPGSASFKNMPIPPKQENRETDVEKQLSRELRPNESVDEHLAVPMHSPRVSPVQGFAPTNNDVVSDGYAHSGVSSVPPTCRSTTSTRYSKVQPERASVGSNGYYSSNAPPNSHYSAAQQVRMTQGLAHVLKRTPSNISQHSNLDTVRNDMYSTRPSEGVREISAPSDYRTSTVPSQDARGGNRSSNSIQYPDRIDHFIPDEKANYDSSSPPQAYHENGRQTYPDDDNKSETNSTNRRSAFNTIIRIKPNRNEGGVPASDTVKCDVGELITLYELDSTAEETNRKNENGGPRDYEYVAAQPADSESETVVNTYYSRSSFRGDVRPSMSYQEGVMNPEVS